MGSEVTPMQVMKSFMNILPIVAVSPYLAIIDSGAMTAEQAGALLATLADNIEGLGRVGSDPFVTAEVAKVIRACSRRLSSGERPALRLVEGGLDAASSSESGSLRDDA